METGELTTVHNPYYKMYMPDGQGAFPTITMEAILYSRPGFIEILPAADDKNFRNGRIEGMNLRTFGVAKWLDWEEDKISLCFESVKEQTIRLCYRKGIQNIGVDGGKLLKVDGIYADVLVSEKPVVITMER